MDMRIRLKRIVKRTKPTKRLTRPEEEHFQKQVEAKLSQYNLNADEEPNALWEALKAANTEELNSMIKAPNTRRDFLSDEAWRLIAQRKELKSCNDVAEYEKVNKFVRNTCRRDKNLFLEKICIEIEKAAERWKEYCANHYKDTSKDQNINAYDGSENEPDILRSEIEYAIKKLKRDKAPGVDCITAEAIKALGEHGISILHKICNVVWRSRVWPTDWVHSSILPLHKKGSIRKCDNYRTIALISHASKVLLHILNSRLRAFLDWQIPQEQAGFVKGKGTREQILNVRQIVEKAYEFNIPVMICFVDYQKAFDCVKWTKLWLILQELGVPNHLVQIIRGLYETGYGTVRLGGSTSSSFKFQKGVRQGCIISPILYNIYGEYIMRKALEGWEGGVKIGGMKISNLRNADDTTLFASSEEEMFDFLRRLEIVSEEMGLAINKKKTKLMVVDRFSSIQRTDRLNDYETVDEFLYLGSAISNKGGSEPEIRRRIGMAKTAMKQLARIWKDSNIRRRTKIHIVRTLVFSIFLYGAETWTIKAADRKRIDAFEMWCWRRLLRIPWTARRTNVSILKELKLERQKRLSSICLSRIIKYFGHIARRNADNIERLIVTGKVEGRRPRGRSPKRWSDQVSECLEVPVHVALHEAEDRGRWKKAVKELLARRHDPQQWGTD